MSGKGFVGTENMVSRARMTTRNVIDSFTEIAMLRIKLKGSDPLIWRVVEVPTSVTLKVLHDIVQAAVGRLDYYLWKTVVDGQTYGSPIKDDRDTEPRKVAARGPIAVRRTSATHLRLRSRQCGASRPPQVGRELHAEGTAARDCLIPRLNAKSVGSRRPPRCVWRLIAANNISAI